VAVDAWQGYALSVAAQITSGGIAPPDIEYVQTDLTYDWEIWGHDRHGERVARFVGERCGSIIYPPFTAMGIERSGQITAGVVFNCYTGTILR
jgi:hypothetical protein